LMSVKRLVLMRAVDDAQIPFAGDVRPYFHVHDVDFATLCKAGKKVRRARSRCAGSACRTIRRSIEAFLGRRLTSPSLLPAASSRPPRRFDEPAPPYDVQALAPRPAARPRRARPSRRLALLLADPDPPDCRLIVITCRHRTRPPALGVERQRAHARRRRLGQRRRGQGVWAAHVEQAARQEGRGGREGDFRALEERRLCVPDPLALPRPVVSEFDRLEPRLTFCPNRRPQTSRATPSSTDTLRR